MEWVETTAKTLDEARDLALDQLGVGADEAEFDVVEEPRPGLFGRTRGQARIRARVMPTPVRPKQERRRRGKSERSSRDRDSKSNGATSSKKGDSSDQDPTTTQKGTGDSPNVGAGSDSSSPNSSEKKSAPQESARDGQRRGANTKKESNMDNEPAESPVTPQEVGDAAVAFMSDLTTAFGASGDVELQIDGTELDVKVVGNDVGLMVGPGGRTMNAIQDLVRVAAQRRLGDHETRLRIDIGGYRERRTAALAKFAAEVAQQVRESGVARSLEPMTSADRKVIHDALNEEDGVESTSAGEDPNRRVVVQPSASSD